MTNHRHQNLAKKHLLIVALLALLAGGAGLFTMPVLDRDEARYVQATTQMLETGDYVQIRFQDQARNKKPVGIYWLQAASVKLFSSVNNRDIWAFRLPSLLLAVLAALATYLAGIKVVGRQASFAGAALFAVSILLGVEAGIAKTDAALVATTTLILLSLARLRRKNDPWMALLFWAALAASILIKGPIGPALVIVSLLSLWAWERKIAWLRPLMTWWGPMLAALIVLPWLWAVQQATDGAFLREALGGDFAAKLAGAKESHGAPPGMYLALLAFTIFPASFFLLPGAIKTWALRKTSKDGADARLLIAWIVPFFLLLELTPTKLVHYPLPLYPALALLCGLGWQYMAEFRWIRWLSSGLGLLMPVLLIAGVFYLQSVDEPSKWNPSWPVFPVLLFMSASAIGASVYIFLKRGKPALILAVLAGLSWQFEMRTFIAPSHPLLQTTTKINAKLIAAGLHPRLSQEASSPVLSVNYREPSLVFALGTDTVLASNENALEKTKQSKAQTIVYSVLNCQSGVMNRYDELSLSAFVDALQTEQQQCIASEEKPFHAYNYSKGQCLSVYIFTLRACK